MTCCRGYSGKKNTRCLDPIVGLERDTAMGRYGRSIASTLPLGQGINDPTYLLIRLTKPLDCGSGRNGHYS